MSTSKPPAVSADQRTALRQRAEAALESGDLVSAQTLAAELAKKTLGPWENTLLGRIAMAAGNPKQARTNLESAHAALPKEGSILTYLAAACAAQGHWKHAVRHIVGAIAQRDDLAELHERHGIYLANNGQIKESKMALQRALELEPQRTTAWALLGERYMDLSDLAAAREALSKAIALDPVNGAALWNLALVAEMEGDFAEAAELLTSQINARADHRRARHRRGQVLLFCGDLTTGWSDYAFRLKNKTYRSWQQALEVPYWSGEDLSGKHIVVWADQGIGEQILTAGLLPDVIGRAGAVTFACEPRLIRVLARSFPDANVVSLEALRDGGKDIDPVELQASISELGAMLRPNMEKFPKPKAYLTPDKERVADFRTSLTRDAHQKPIVGISWRSDNATVGHEKSTSLSHHWQAVLNLPDVHLVSLQYGDVAEELADAEAATGTRIASVAGLDPKADLDGFTALAAAMDAVVSTSNTTVHIAGALGVPTWAMIPQNYGCPWYWFREGEASPWYSNLTLLRRQNGWGDVVQEAATRLRAHLR